MHQKKKSSKIHCPFHNPISAFRIEHFCRNFVRKRSAYDTPKNFLQMNQPCRKIGSSRQERIAYTTPPSGVSTRDTHSTFRIVNLIIVGMHLKHRFLSSPKTSHISYSIPRRTSFLLITVSVCVMSITDDITIRKILIEFVP